MSCCVSRSCDHAVRAFLDRERAQQRGDAAVDVLQGQHLDVLGQLAHARDQAVDQQQREVGLRDHELAQVGAGDHHAGGRLQCHHRGAAHPAVESDLADVLARAVGVEDHLLAGLVRGVHLDPAGQQDEERVVAVALRDDHRVGGVALDPAARGHVLEHALAEHRQFAVTLVHAAILRPAARAWNTEPVATTGRPPSAESHTRLVRYGAARAAPQAEHRAHPVTEPGLPRRLPCHPP